MASVNRVAIFGLPEGLAGTFRARRLEILLRWLIIWPSFLKIFKKIRRNTPLIEDSDHYFICKCSTMSIF